MLKHQDLKLDILKIEAVRYEKILLENANANVQKYAYFWELIILELHLGEALKHCVKNR